MLSQFQINQFDQQGYLILNNSIESDLIQKCLRAYVRMRSKCENYTYLRFRKFRDIALNDIYAIENIFHPDIFEEDIFNSIISSKVLEVSQELLQDKNIFLSLSRLHCTKNISHSGNWHRDGTPSGISEDIDKMLIENEKKSIHIQATLPYFKETGFYIVPGSHKNSKNYIKTSEILGTKKILKEEIKLKINPGELLVFNPFIIHRGACVGRIKNQRAHIHMRLTRSSQSHLSSRNKTDEMSYKNLKIYNLANANWKKCFDQKLTEPKTWVSDITEKKINFLSVRTICKIFLIFFNRSLYYLSKYLPFSLSLIHISEPTRPY